MAYGLKYITNFDGGPQGLHPYTLEFHFKDWTGTFNNFLVSGVPVIHSWDKDEPKPGIKGSSLTIEGINTGSLPLSAFFSVEDDNCMVIYKWRTQVLFEGFLVQDDCTEIMVDYAHVINFTATDNLGLLKGVPFNQAAAIVGSTPDRIVTGVLAYSDILPVSGVNFIVINNPIVTGAIIGDSMRIQGTPGSDGIYIISNINYTGTVTFIDIQGVFPFAIPPNTIYTFTFITPYDLSSRLPLSVFLKIGLLNTGLQLHTDVYANIIESSVSTPRFLDETFITGTDFSNNNNDFKNCYDVLNIIFERFNATLFQAEGVWNIIRRDEHRYYDNEITGFRYNEKMVYSSEITFDDIFTSEPAIDPSVAVPITYPVNGITKSILRPYKFDKETFNYKQPADLLRNYNLQYLGAYIQSFTVGDIVYSDYDFLYWFDGPFPGQPFRRIRIGIDTTTGFEVSRVAVLVGLTGDSARSAASTSIDADKGDVCTFGYSFRTDGSQAGPIFFIIAFGITDGTDIYYLQNDDTWSSTVGPGKRFNVPSGSNTIDWQNMSITTSPFPVSGKLTVYIDDHQNYPTPSSETYIKDLTFTYIPSINGVVKIIGHTHTDTQSPTIKNNEEVEIQIDDCPRNSINGALFLSSTTGVLRNRTSLWTYPFSIAGPARLGFWTTFEQLFWRRIPRTKMEGTMYGLVQPLPKRYLVEQIWENVDVPPLVHGVQLPAEIIALLNVGDSFTIEGTADNDGTYTVLSFGATGNPLFVETGSPVTMEGPVTAYIILQNIPRHISMLTLIKYAGLPGLNFIFGVMNIDYKNNNSSGTFWEQWALGETDLDLSKYYEYEYLYDIK